MRFIQPQQHNVGVLNVIFVHQDTFAELQQLKLEGLTNIFVLCRFSMPYTPLRQLKQDGLTAMFGTFNFDDLDSDDEVPEQEQRR